MVALLDGHKDPGEKIDPELLADGVEDGTHQQSAEQTLCHGTQGVNAVTLGGEYNVFSLQELAHIFFPF
jgi:hypothetical protein